MSTLQFNEIKDLIDKPDPVVIEIGANVGRDSQRFLDTFPGIRLYCIEPDPRCIAKFDRRINDDRCTLHKFAVADYDGDSKLLLSSGSKSGHKSPHINSSSLLEPTGHLEKFPWCEFIETADIQVRTLDKWAEEEGIEEVDFIWADTQGGEKMMILGGLQVLSRTRYLYTEYSDSELYKGQPKLKDILYLLPSYRIAKGFPTNVLLKNES